MDEKPNAVRDPERLDALRRSRLLDSPAEAAAGLNARSDPARHANIQ
jgi:hypothetical protein